VAPGSGNRSPAERRSNTSGPRWSPVLICPQPRRREAGEGAERIALVGAGRPPLHPIAVDTTTEPPAIWDFSSVDVRAHRSIVAGRRSGLGRTVIQSRHEAQTTSVLRTRPGRVGQPFDAAASSAIMRRAAQPRTAVAVCAGARSRPASAAGQSPRAGCRCGAR